MPTSRPSGWPRRGPDLKKLPLRHPRTLKDGTDPSLELADSVLADIHEGRRPPRGARARVRAVRILAVRPGATSSPWRLVLAGRGSTACCNQAPQTVRRRLRPLAGAVPGGAGPAGPCPENEVIRDALARRQDDRRHAERSATGGRAAASPLDRDGGLRPERTSTATATSPARASCPATTSRGCRCRRSSRPESTRQQREEYLSRPALPGHLGVRASLRSSTTRVQPLRDQPRHPFRSMEDGVADHAGPSSASRVRLRPPDRRTAPARILCERCRAQTAETNCGNLLRLQNVATRRKDKINCDEEERLRLGYEIRTGIRFAERGGVPVHPHGGPAHGGRGANWPP